MALCDAVQTHVLPFRIPIVWFFLFCAWFRRTNCCMWRMYRQELMNLSDPKCDARCLVIISSSQAFVQTPRKRRWGAKRVCVYVAYVLVRESMNGEWRISCKRVNDKLQFFPVRSSCWVILHDNLALHTATEHTSSRTLFSLYYCRKTYRTGYHKLASVYNYV